MTHSQKSSRPHIIYFLSDEHRGQALSLFRDHGVALGDADVQTPRMDQMGREGVAFATAFANCPICMPSRGTIFSGRHAHSGPITAQDHAWLSAFPSTASLLRRSGYHTAYFGKTHFGMYVNQVPPEIRFGSGQDFKGAKRTPERHRLGFQDWHAYESCESSYMKTTLYHGHDRLPVTHEGYQTDVLTDLALAYLRDYDRPEPLFLVVSVLPPHFPLNVPASWVRYDPDTLTLRPNASDTPEYRRNLALYYAMIENIDWNLGRLLDTVDQLPRFTGEQTCCAYFSDHGDFMGSHRRHSRKEYPHEESSRVPMLFRQPDRIPARGVVNDLFSLVDLMPTTLALAGVDCPDYVHGTSFLPALQGDLDFAAPDEVLIELCMGPRYSLDFMDYRAIRTRDMMYAFYETGHEQLYDLSHDPYQLCNLLADTPGHHMREVMHGKLRRLLEKTREPVFDTLMNYAEDLQWLAGTSLDVCGAGDTQNHPELAPPPSGCYRW